MQSQKLALLALAAALGCNDSGSPAKSVSPELQQEAFRGNGDYVATPAGLYHRTCVHEVEDGARIGKNGLVRRRNGTTYQLPACMYRSFKLRPDHRGKDDILAPTNNGWVEWVQATQTLPAYYGKLTANWTVPSNPSAGLGAGQVYYTFPGLQNATYIIQPVVQFGFNNDLGGTFWQMASWHCNGNCTHSTPHAVAAGDAMYGSISASSCANGTCTWTIVTKDLTANDSTVMNVTDDNHYNWSTGGAVEVYGLTSCNQYPINGVIYSSIKAYNGSMTQIYPSWTNKVTAGLSPSCGFRLTSTTDSVVLYHNPGPAPSISSLSTNPSPPRQYISFALTVNGSGFNPATAEIVYSQPCYPPGSWCPQVYPNNQLTTKTQTQLVAQMAFSIANDTVRIQVRNGILGTLSNTQQIVILPM